MKRQNQDIKNKRVCIGATTNAARRKRRRGRLDNAIDERFKDTVRARARRDRQFREALLTEATDCFLAGDVDTGKAVSADYVHATVGFDELSRVTRKSSKSLMRMLGPKGNPQASNLFRDSQLPSVQRKHPIDGKSLSERHDYVTGYTLLYIDLETSIGETGWHFLRFGRGP